MVKAVASGVQVDKRRATERGPTSLYREATCNFYPPGCERQLDSSQELYLGQPVSQGAARFHLPQGREDGFPSGRLAIGGRAAGAR